MFDNLPVTPNETWIYPLVSSFGVGLVQICLNWNELDNKTARQVSRRSQTTFTIIGIHDLCIAFVFAFYSYKVEHNGYVLMVLAWCFGIASFIAGLMLEKIKLAHTLEDGITWSNAANHFFNLGANIAKVPKPPPPGLFENIRYINGIMIWGYILMAAIAYSVDVASKLQPTPRKIYEYVLVLALNSYWFPQFAWNTLQNRTDALLWKFVYETSILRLLPVWYLCKKSSNVFGHSEDPILFVVIVVWITFQLFLLVLQAQFGARFWLIKDKLPQVYDYHHSLNADEIDRVIKSNELKRSSEADNGIRVECHVCKQSIILSPSEKIESTQHYMVTPCFHLFHTDCLEGVMEYKLQCPRCRNGIPL